MRPGDILKNMDTGEERFRVTGLLAEGRSYLIAEGEDLHLDDLPVILKAIAYPDDASAEVVRQRREALRLEVQALTVPSVLLPEPIDFFHVASDVGVSDPREPVLVLEIHRGKTLRQEMTRSPQGLHPTRALQIVREVAQALGELHEAGYAFRDLNPDHVVIGVDDIIHLVGTGNIARIEQRPLAAKLGVSERYSAPEIRDEISGKFIRPEADIYSLGALLVFLLTGVDPAPRIEAPIPPDAYDRLLAMPEGYRLLVTRCMQPLAKRRFRQVAALLPYLDPGHLPTPESRGFSKLDLPTPITPDGEYDAQNRALRSRLSAGPLISVPTERPAEPPRPAPQAPEAKSDLPAPVQRPWWQSCLPWAGGALLALVVGIAAVVGAVV